MNQYELVHYGMPRRSGRYPWGSGKRPHQSSEKRMNKNERLKKEQQKRVDDYVTSVIQGKRKFTNQELQTALTRLNLETQLSLSINGTYKKNGMARIDSVMKRIKTLTGWTATGIVAWNTMAKVYNATNKGQKHPLPIINTSSKKKG